MHTRKLLATSAFASALVVCAAASAGPNGAIGNWGGFYVDAALGARSTSTPVTDQERMTSTSAGVGFSSSSVSAFSTKTDFGDTSFLAQFSGGWRWANGPVVVGVGAFIDWAGDGAGSRDSASSTTFTSTVGATTTTTVSTGFYNETLKQKSRYGISLDIGPNWRTHPYAKLSYAWSEYEYTARTGPCSPTNPAIGPTGFSFNDTLSGFGLGGGVRHMQTENLYFFAEVMWQDYGSKNNRVQPVCSLGQPVVAGLTQTDFEQIKLEPSNFTGVIGVGWKF